MVALQHLVDPIAPPLALSVARARVDQLREGLPETLLATRPEDIRRLARTSLDADCAALRRRSKVGERPALDAGAAQRAIDAHAAARDARGAVRAASSEAMRWLAAGNVWGVASLAASAVMVRAGVEPMAVPVYASMLGAATGPLATAMLGVVRRRAARKRLVRAHAAWADALERAGFETMGELAARGIAVGAWKRRVAEADAAIAVARDAKAAWHRVAGPGSHPREAPALIARLAILRAAQLDLLRSLIVTRMRTRELAPFDLVWNERMP